LKLDVTSEINESVKEVNNEVVMDGMNT